MSASAIDRTTSSHRCFTYVPRYLALGLGKPGPETPFFDRADGRPWHPNEMSRIFSRSIRKHKLPAIRSRFTARQSDLGLRRRRAAQGISESLGHSSIAVTSVIYVHVLDQTKSDAADAFEAFVGPAMTPRPKAVSES